MGWIHQDDESDHEGFVVPSCRTVKMRPGTRGRTPKRPTRRTRNGHGASSTTAPTASRGPRASGSSACAAGRDPARRSTSRSQTAEEVLRRQWYHHAEVSMARTLPPHVQRLFDELEEAVLGPGCTAAKPDDLDDTRPLAAIYAATLLRDHAERWQKTAVRARQGRLLLEGNRPPRGQGQAVGTRKIPQFHRGLAIPRRVRLFGADWANRVEGSPFRPGPPGWPLPRGDDVHRGPGWDEEARHSDGHRRRRGGESPRHRAA